MAFPSIKRQKALKYLRTPFGFALVVAALIHLPATPLMMLFSFVATLIDLKDADRVDYNPEPMTIAVELAEPLQSKPAAAPPKDDVKAVQMEPESPSEAVKLPKGEERQPEAKAEQPDKDPASEAAEQKKAEEEKKKKPEALGITGEVSKSVEGKTNVTLTVWFSTMRDYPSSDSFKPMLACGLLGAAFQRAGIDPVQDLDGALFAGQQLNDPKDYLVAVHHHLPKEQMHEAIDKLLRPKGTWLQADVAKFYAAKSQRVVFPHGEKLLFITPEKGWQQVRAIRKPLAVPAGRGRVLSLNLLKPSIPFKKLGFKLPASLTEMRLDVFLSSTGTAEVQLRFEDRDAESAQRNAPIVGARLKDFLWQVQKVSDLSGLIAPSAGAVQLPELPLVADDKAVVGQATLTEEQTRQLMDRVGALLCSKPKEKPAASAAPSASAPPALSAAPPASVSSAPAP
jgi:hypothetical protein